MRGAMTAEEWETSTDVEAVRLAVHNDRSTRKAYCFGLACLRLIWDQIPGHMRRVVEVTERYVERKATNAERARARALVRRERSEIESAVNRATAAPTDIRASARGLVPLHVRL